ncbi:MAG TPA: peptidylprolyl isomerase [Bacteroidales bacterium]|nr:peptidylprolyl isomerase [Bacteroidales bacterium]
MNIKHIFAVALIVALTACNKEYTPKNIELANESDSISYAMGVVYGTQLSQYINAKNDSVYDGVVEVCKGLSKGVNNHDKYAKYEMIGKQIGQMFKKNQEEGLMGDSLLIPDKDIFVQALANTLLEDQEAMTGMEANTYLQTLQMEQQRQENERLYGANRLAGEEFLAAKKNEPGITATESGILYQVIKNGKGPKPTIDDNVKVHYHGTLIDGTVFDSSVDRGTPVEFALRGVIPGWTEVLQLMPVGSKWKVYIPQELAYGDRNMGTIKPFSALIFDIELLEIAKK